MSVYAPSFKPRYQVAREDRRFTFASMTHMPHGKGKALRLALLAVLALPKFARAQPDTAVQIGARVRVTATDRNVTGAWRGADSAALRVLESADGPVTTIPRSTVQRMSVSEGIMPGNFGRGARRGALYGLAGGVVLFTLAAWHDAVTPRSSFWTPTMTAAITGALLLLPPTATLIGAALTRHDTERWRTVAVP